MELARMINQMCHETLADADINAIRKVRGFSQKEIASRAAFESFFLSSIGLEKVMETLCDEEIATLHLLKRQGEEVDITFFERLYGDAENKKYYYSGTFTQQYKLIYDQVKQNLVRKGVLVVVEAKLRGDTVQMERWRYRFPPEFAPYLPGLIRRPQRSAAHGEVNHAIIRKKLLETVGGPIISSSPQLFQLSLSQGTLLLDGKPFQAAQIPAWQEAGWRATIQAISPNDKASLPPEQAIPAILETLQPDEWITDSQIAPLLKIFCFGAKLPETAKVCEAGWHWGLLERIVEGSLTYYRLPAKTVETTTPPQYLAVDPGGKFVQVDLHRIPSVDLESLNRLARLEVQNNNLIAFPDLIKLGRASTKEHQSALSTWLRQHVPAFEQTAISVEEKWGKNLIHMNLHIARVRDLSLRVQLERDLKENLLVLSDQFVAFPVGCANEVEKSVKKAGFVVKVVRP